MSKQHKATVVAAVLAAALLGQAAAVHASTAGMFGMRATFEPNHVVFEMRLPALCLRLQAEIPGFIVASARMFVCEDCAGASSARSWS